MPLLAGDIGGTKTVLGIFSAEQGPKEPVVYRTFPSQDYDSLEAITEEFYSSIHIQIDSACFGVAGPVIDGKSQVTNLPWVVDTKVLEEKLELKKIFLLNDLQAIANAVPILGSSDQEIIVPGEVEPDGAIGILAPGTGLGEAFLTRTSNGYQAHPSEGGHVDFAPTNEREMGLLAFLFERYRHVSYERVCSGLGIPNIYAYFKESGFSPEPDWLRQELDRVEDPTPVIVRAALDPQNPNPLCRHTFETFVSIMGAEAGNLALKILATGGIYLGGGIPPKILPSLHDGTFQEAFFRKGRFADFIKKVQVSVILNESAALIGAANFGLKMGPN